ncbi:hypothetical protein ACQHIH_20960 [Xanthomonas sontii]|uniref:hypothetical protein n=1 Tax=Xanthomonas sontii TaxID=2650745 RepID=UPI003F82FA18
MHAYDIEPGDWQDGAPAPDSDGWCFGLPPGITAAQWPLDPWSGYPMQHGFTLRLPPDYRVHGPDIVAVSFFATAPDHNDGGPAGTVDGMHAAIATPAQALADPALQPFRERALQAHPRLRRMQDLLDCAYALILLRQEEVDGAPCRPPPLVDSPLLQQTPPPEWLQVGSATVCEAWDARSVPLPQAPDRFALHRPLRLRLREHDPNAGVPPRETFGDAPDPGGYQPFYYWQDGVVSREHYREHDWAAGHAINHLGGTMRPIQGIPDFSPYYIEFDETFGGYNFGGGIAQLDIQDLRLDWACG